MSDAEAAERLLLKPLATAPTEPERRSLSVRAAVEAIGRRDLRPGDVVTARGLSYVVRRSDPRGRSRVEPGRTVVEFDFAAEPAKRAVADVVFLLDASYSMRRADLPPSRIDSAKRAVVTALSNCGDVVRRAAVASFGSDSGVVAGFAPPASVDLGALDDVVPRGPGEVLAALDQTIETLAHDGDPLSEHAILLATDARASVIAATEVAARAARLGIEIHVLDCGSPSPSVLGVLAEKTSGTIHDAQGGVTFRPALQTLASRFGVPLSWRDPARTTGEVEFEVVLRAMTEREANEFPAVPRRFRRK